jgi:hypothetical protein
MRLGLQRRGPFNHSLTMIGDADVPYWDSRAMEIKGPGRIETAAI